MSNSERGLLERTYNLCDKHDYDEAKAYYNDPSFTSYVDFISDYYYFYLVKDGKWGLLHNLNGPAIAYKNKTVEKPAEYYIYGEFLSEVEFNNHEKVKQYRYLKEHPEMKAFV